MEIALKFGALSESIGRQLEKQGVITHKSSIKKWEKIAFSITLLRIHSIISDEESKRAYDKLMRLIAEEL